MYFRLANEHLWILLKDSLFSPPRAVQRTHTHACTFPLSDWSICLFVADVRVWYRHGHRSTADGFVIRSTEYSSGLPLWIFHFNPSMLRWICKYEQQNYNVTTKNANNTSNANHNCSAYNHHNTATDVDSTRLGDTSIFAIWSQLIYWSNAWI